MIKTVVKQIADLRNQGFGRIRIANKLKMSPSTVQHHLAIAKNEGLLTDTKCIRRELTAIDETQLVADLMNCGYGRTEIAKQLKITMSTARDRMSAASARGLVNIPQNDVTIADKLKNMAKELDEKNLQIMALSELAEQVNQVSRKFKIVRDVSKAESVAVAVISDWHIEETVDGKTVEFINEFNLKIAEQRVSALFQNIMKLVELCRSKSEIGTMILAILGDLISGYIHEELVEGNDLSPTQATIKAYELLCAGIDFVLKNGKFKNVILVLNWGNHGRTTVKKKISTGALNSFEWLMYHFIAQRYVGDKRVVIKIADGYFNYLDVYNYVIRFHHGDFVRFAGGVGGIHIPLNKAIDKWNQMKKANLDVLGHWHTRKSDFRYVVNGSLIGFGPYAISIKAEFEEPTQSFFLIHPKHCKTVEAPIFLC